MRFGEFLQKIGSKGVWSPTSQAQHEVIDELGRIIEGQINWKVSSEQIFGKPDLFEFLEQVETPVPQWGLIWFPDSNPATMIGETRRLGSDSKNDPDRGSLPTQPAGSTPCPWVSTLRKKEKPEPRGSGSRELHNLSSYKNIIASHALEVNVTEGDSLS